MFDPAKVFPPMTEEQMKKRNKRNTICETLRLAYSDIDSGELEDAKFKLRVAVTMAKAMDKKLKFYNRSFARNLFPLKDKRQK